ncbi:DUF1905 domain-containing protein [Microcella sp.]|uniref:DUF1905 domain-containing protein n=1 Tax=Microcella sp. TaxID=1913979 RepID=UPI002562FACE|nr:DUF1905 domain-containing protein [Microcella sp.]MBX9472990.1 DUF1905 domain-containing protein [Microcella sp.]
MPASRTGRAPAYDFAALLWEWEGKAAWFFVTVPVDISDEIDARTEGFTNGFGSVRVRVRIGGSEWMTSLFPDSKRQAYLLPIKKAVRQAEGLDDGSTAQVGIELADFS